MKPVNRSPFKRFSSQNTLIALCAFLLVLTSTLTVSVAASVSSASAAQTDAVRGTPVYVPISSITLTRVSFDPSNPNWDVVASLASSPTFGHPNGRCTDRVINNYHTCVLRIAYVDVSYRQTDQYGLTHYNYWSPPGVTTCYRQGSAADVAYWGAHSDIFNCQPLHNWFGYVWQGHNTGAPQPIYEANYEAHESWSQAYVQTLHEGQICVQNCPLNHNATYLEFDAAVNVRTPKVAHASGEASPANISLELTKISCFTGGQEAPIDPFAGQACGLAPWLAYYFVPSADTPPDLVNTDPFMYGPVPSSFTWNPGNFSTTAPNDFVQGKDWSWTTQGITPNQPARSLTQNSTAIFYKATQPDSPFTVNSSGASVAYDVQAANWQPCNPSTSDQPCVNGWQLHVITSQRGTAIPSVCVDVVSVATETNTAKCPFPVSSSSVKTN